MKKGRIAYFFQIKLETNCLLYTADYYFEINFKTHWNFQFVYFYHCKSLQMILIYDAQTLK